MSRPFSEHGGRRPRVEQVTAEIQPNPSVPVGQIENGNNLPGREPSFVEQQKRPLIGQGGNRLIAANPSPNFQREPFPQRGMPKINRGGFDGVVVNKSVQPEPPRRPGLTSLTNLPQGEIRLPTGDGQGSRGNPGEKPVEASAGGGQGEPPQPNQPEGQQGGSEQPKQPKQPRQPRQPSRLGKVELSLRATVSSRARVLRRHADKTLLNREIEQIAPDDQYNARVRIARIGKINANLLYPQGWKPKTAANLGAASFIAGVVNEASGGNIYFDSVAAVATLYVATKVAKGSKQREKEYNPVVGALTEAEIAAGIALGAVGEVAGAALPDPRLWATAEVVAGFYGVGKAVQKIHGKRVMKKQMGKDIVSAATDVEKMAVFDQLVGDDGANRAGLLQERKEQSEATALRAMNAYIELAARGGRHLEIGDKGQLQEVQPQAGQGQQGPGEQSDAALPAGNLQTQQTLNRTERRRLKRLGNVIEAAQREASYNHRLREGLLESRKAKGAYLDTAQELYRLFDLH